MARSAPTNPGFMKPERERRSARNKRNKRNLLALPPVSFIPCVPRSNSLSFDEGCQGNPSLVVGILRFVLKHVAAGETEVFQFLLKALAMHSDSFGGAGDVDAGFGEHAFDVGGVDFAAGVAEIVQVRVGA